MKYIFTILFSSTFLHLATAQEATHPIVDQVMISINTSLEKNSNTENRVGYGLGIYHTFLPENWINFNTGIEFNSTRQFEKSQPVGHFISYENLTYSKNCISLPLNLRVTVGQKRLFFFEIGGFWDAVISSNKKGTLHSAIPDGNGEVQDQYKDIDEDAGLASSLGVSFGIGIRIPCNEFDLVIKPDYKQIFNEEYGDNYHVLRKYMRINMGITLK